MADMSQVNLERLRATDAMWEETKHPRADNGQFTSGSGGGGAKVTKATPGMTGGKFQTREQAVNRAIEQHSPKMNAALKGIKKAEKEEADMESKYYRGFNRLNKMGKTDLGYDLLERFDEKRKVPQMKRQQQLSKYNRALGKEMDQINNITKTFQAAGKTLAKARPGIAKMREQAKAAGSGEPHAKALESLAADFKRDPFISKYANELAKAARSGGEAAIAKRAEEIRNEIQGANTPGFQKSVQNGRLDYVLKEYKNGMAKQPVQQPAAKPQESTAEVHPMEGDVKKDIQYWLQSHYRNPSDKQKADAVESIGEQYKSYLKTAEKNWKLAQSVPDLDEATRNKYKKKYDDATEKLKAFEGMWKHGRFWN